MRGLKNVRAEFSLTALAYNLRRAITVIGVPGMNKRPSLGADRCSERPLLGHADLGHQSPGGKRTTPNFVRRTDQLDFRSRKC